MFHIFSTVRRHSAGICSSVCWAEKSGIVGLLVDEKSQFGDFARDASYRVAVASGVIAEPGRRGPSMAGEKPRPLDQDFVAD